MDDAKIRFVRDALEQAQTALAENRIENAYELIDQARDMVQAMLEPADPYRDMKLRPNLRFATVGEAAAAGMIAPPQTARAQDPAHQFPPKETSDG